MSTSIESITADLTDLFNEEIMSYLTDTDNEDSSPVSEDIAQSFIDDNSEMILTVITTMCEEYDENGNLSDLTEPESDWIREYIFDGGDLEKAIKALRTPSYEDSEDNELPPTTASGVKASNYFDYVSKIYNKMKVDGWPKFKIGSIDYKASAFVEGRWQFVEDGKSRDPIYSDALAYASFLKVSAKMLTK
jgi:hypothetical protein